MSKNINSIMRTARYTLEAQVEKDDGVKLTQDVINQMNRADERVGGKVRTQRYTPVGGKPKQSGRRMSTWTVTSDIEKYIDSHKE